MKTQFKKLNDTATIPVRKTEGSAGFDFYTPVEFSLKPGERVAIDTHISCAIPAGFVGEITSRSSLAKEDGIIVITGTIDSDYRGEIKICLANIGKFSKFFYKDTRIAQMLVVPALFESEEVTELDDPGTRSGGFGSTGS